MLTDRQTDRQTDGRTDGHANLIVGLVTRNPPKNEQRVFSLAYIQPKNTVYRTTHPIYCLRKLI